MMVMFSKPSCISFILAIVAKGNKPGAAFLARSSLTPMGIKLRK
jgi:hypothetical protein